jgi:acyl-CoA synthetase (AMP-forming)/AMP-acid ligase II
VNQRAFIPVEFQASAAVGENGVRLPSYPQHTPKRLGFDFEKDRSFLAHVSPVHADKMDRAGLRRRRDSAHASWRGAGAVRGPPDWGCADREREILEHCRTHLSSYKVPSSVHFISEIPRTGSGKIIRYKLRESLDVARET